MNSFSLLTSTTLGFYSSRERTLLYRFHLSPASSPPNNRYTCHWSAYVSRKIQFYQINFFIFSLSRALCSIFVDVTAMQPEIIGTKVSHLNERLPFRFWSEKLSLNFNISFNSEKLEFPPQCHYFSDECLQFSFGDLNQKKKLSFCIRDRICVF